MQHKTNNNVLSSFVEEKDKFMDDVKAKKTKRHKVMGSTAHREGKIDSFIAFSQKS